MLTHGTKIVKATKARKPTVNRRREHYVIADALGYGSFGRITVRKIVQTREEAVTYVARRPYLQAWRDAGGEHVWHVGDRVSTQNWVTEIRGGSALKR